MGLILGDTAAEDPPWSMFESWWESSVKLAFSGRRDPLSPNRVTNTNQSFEHWKTCSVESTGIWPTRSATPSIERVSLQLGDTVYPALGNISDLPPNTPADPREPDMCTKT
jgi:hypothetical protein